VGKTLFTVLVFGMFSVMLFAQEENPVESEMDSLQTSLNEEVIVTQDSILKKENYINPLAPSRAALVFMPILSTIISIKNFGQHLNAKELAC